MVNRITLVEVILLPYCRRRIEHVFVLQGTSICNHSEDLWKKIQLKLPGIFKEIYEAVPPVFSC